jgi:YD repeat-containing protein
MKKGFLHHEMMLFMVMALILSCSKSDPAPIVCYLTSSSMVGTFTYQETLVYDNSNHVVSIISEQPGFGGITATFVYASNGNLATGDFGDGTTATYVFDSNNRMILRTFAPDGKTLSLVYNATGQNTSRTFTDPTCATCGYHITYTYPNTSTHNYNAETYTDSGSTRSSTYEYDSKPNPYKLVLYSSTGTDNNVTQRVTTDGSGSSTVTYTYTYNDKGYPLTQVSSEGTTTTYAYNCK